MTTKVGQRRRARTATARPVEQEQIRVASHEEGWKLLDERARRYLNISAEEFIQRWNAGVYRDDADRPDVIRVAAALPFVRATTSRRS